jgi:hypothetical protein
MLRGRLAHLSGSGEVNKSIGKVERRAVESARIDRIRPEIVPRQHP